MTTLVTGASGHVGNNIVKQLLAAGRPVRAMVRKTSPLTGLQDTSGKLLAGVELVRGDLLDPASLGRAVAGCTRVFHTAAVFKTRLPDENIMLRTNIEGTRNLLSACRNQALEKIIYTSSVAAVGCSRTPEIILDEATWNQDPIDAYVQSKLDSERLAVKLAADWRLPVVFVNPGTILGPNDFSDTPSNSFIRLAMQKLPPVYFAGGHSYTDVEDVARGHLLAEQHGKIGERYILAGENASIEDLFLRISRLTGKRPPRIKIGHLFVTIAGAGFETLAKITGGRPLFTRKKAHKLIDYYGYFSSQKAEQELGYTYRSLDEQLLRCKSWFSTTAN